MSNLPPLPPGFVLEKPTRRDPWEILKAEGFVATNGYRTKGDVERIRAQGYKPATNGAHNRGDGVDLDHPTLTPAQQTKRLKELFGDWPGAFIDDEGHHRHMGLPGWGAAPGTPGTPNSGLPPVPEGFELQQRGPISSSNFADAPPQMSETDARIATIQQSVAEGTFSREEGAKLAEDIKGEGKVSRTDPRSLARMEAAFAKGMGYKDLLNLAGQLGINVNPADLRNALAWRAKGGKGPANFVADVESAAPEAPPEDAPGLANRLAAAVPRGVANVLGAPVDLLNAGLGAIGVPVSDRPYGGSRHILDTLELGGYVAGEGRPYDYNDPSLAPQSTPERYGQAAVQFVAENAVPAVALIGKGGQILTRTGSAATAANQASNPVRLGARALAVEAAKRPGVVIAGDLGGSIGAAVGGEAARDVFPDSPAAEVAGQLIGGLGGGLGAGLAAARPKGSVDAIPSRADIPPLPEGFELETGPHGPIYGTLQGTIRLRWKGCGLSKRVKCLVLFATLRLVRSIWCGAMKTMASPRSSLVTPRWSTTFPPSLSASRFGKAQATQATIASCWRMSRTGPSSRLTLTALSSGGW